MATAEEAEVPAAVPETKEDKTWAKSEAKRVLSADIISGIVKPSMPPKEVHESRAIFKNYKCPQFRTNLKNLREALARDWSRMLHDVECCGHDAAHLIGHREKYPFKEIPFNLSPAFALLKLDISAGVHDRMIPSQMWRTRSEYLAYEPVLFRKRIYQEVKRRGKILSNIRFGRKQFRANPADDVPAQNHHLDMINECNKAAPKKPKRDIPRPMQ